MVGIDQRCKVSRLQVAELASAVFLLTSDLTCLKARADHRQGAAVPVADQDATGPLGLEDEGDVLEDRDREKKLGIDDDDNDSSSDTSSVGDQADTNKGA